MKILNIVGARPQFIKASVISRILNNSEKNIKEILVHSGQHYDNNMSDVFFSELNITRPKYYIKSNKKNTDLQFGDIMSELRKIAINEKPNLFLVYGDTNTTLASALVASKMSIKIAHVESGLRSYRLGMDEEINRLLTDRLSDYLFCNSLIEKNTLDEEGIIGEKYVVGDIMYDSYKFFFNKINKNIDQIKHPNKILLTMHRAENVDDKNTLSNLIMFLNALSLEFEIHFPIHPRTNQKIKDFNINLSGKIKLFNPFSYSELIKQLNSSSYVITDSGGLQKEAYFSKTKCFTIREETEWNNTLKNNANTILSPKINYTGLIEKLKKSINNKYRFDNSLFGKGNAGEKIIEVIKSRV